MLLTSYGDDNKYSIFGQRGAFPVALETLDEKSSKNLIIVA